MDFTDKGSVELNTNALISLIAIAIWLSFGACLWASASRFATQLVAEDLRLIKTIRNADEGDDQKQNDQVTHLSLVDRDSFIELTIKQIYPRRPRRQRTMVLNWRIA
jgi:hypothetical protein